MVGLAQGFLLAYSYELEEEVRQKDVSGETYSNDELAILKNLKIVKIFYMVSIAFCIVTIGISVSGILKISKNQAIVESMQSD